MNTTSPSKVSIRVDFPEAMRAVARGKRVARPSWAQNEYGALSSVDGEEEGKLQLRLADGLDHDWIVSESDIAATDWIIL